MVQEFWAVRCGPCGAYQVTQKKRSMKLACVACGERRTIRSVLMASNDARDCRAFVQARSAEAGRAQELAAARGGTRGAGGFGNSDGDYEDGDCGDYDDYDAFAGAGHPAGSDELVPQARTLADLEAEAEQEAADEGRRAGRGQPDPGAADGSSGDASGDPRHGRWQRTVGTKGTWSAFLGSDDEEAGGSGGGSAAELIPSGTRPRPPLGPPTESPPLQQQQGQRPSEQQQQQQRIVPACGQQRPAKGARRDGGWSDRWGAWAQAAPPAQPAAAPAICKENQQARANRQGEGGARAGDGDFWADLLDG